MFVACGIWCLADVSSISPSSEQTTVHGLLAVCSGEGLTLETSANHHIPQATNIPYQPRVVSQLETVASNMLLFHGSLIDTISQIQSFMVVQLWVKCSNSSS